jgi:hypothetical protein
VEAAGVYGEFEDLELVIGSQLERASGVVGGMSCYRPLLVFGTDDM